MYSDAGCPVITVFPNNPAGNYVVKACYFDHNSDETMVVEYFGHVFKAISQKFGIRVESDFFDTSLIQICQKDFKLFMYGLQNV